MTETKHDREPAAPTAEPMASPAELERLCDEFLDPECQRLGRETYASVSATKTMIEGMFTLARALKARLQAEAQPSPTARLPVKEITTAIKKVLYFGWPKSIDQEAAPAIFQDIWDAIEPLLQGAALPAWPTRELALEKIEELIAYGNVHGKSDRNMAKAIYDAILALKPSLPAWVEEIAKRQKKRADYFDIAHIEPDGAYKDVAALLALTGKELKP